MNNMDVSVTEQVEIISGSDSFLFELQINIQIDYDKDKNLIDMAVTQPVEELPWWN